MSSPTLFEWNRESLDTRSVAIERNGRVATFDKYFDNMNYHHYQPCQIYTLPQNYDDAESIYWKLEPTQVPEGS